MKIIQKTISGIVALFLLGAFPTAGQAAGLPQVTSLAASNIASTSVTLNGFFNANGAPTSAWFRYGTSPSNLASSTNPTSVGNATGTYNATVNGLNPGTTYYFRAVAANFYGTTNATSILQFSTPPAPATSLSLITLAASNLTSNSATLNGHFNVSGPSATLWFQYGTSASAMNSLTSTQAGMTGSSNYSANITGLNPGTTYYFRAVGSQAGVINYATSTLQFTTSTAPAMNMTVTTLAQTGVTPTSAVLNGYITMTGTNAVNRHFKWGTSTSNLNQILSIGGVQTSFGGFSGTLTGLNPGTTYYFKAYAVNNAGTTVVANNLIQFTTPGLPPVTYACSDGIDNDGDGLIDSADPGCTGPTDNSEYNVPPPPPTTYACNDGIDNDGDGLIDFPSDPGCATATDNNENNVINTASAPSVTTGFAQNIYQNGATFTGTVSSNNSYTYYWFEYGQGGSLGTSTAQTSFGLSTGTVSLAVGTLQPNTTYSYRLCASNAMGQNCGSVRSFITPAAPCTSNCGGCTYNCGPTGHAPIVNTSSASNVTDTTAIVYGFVDTQNSGTAQISFRYGSYGNLNQTAYPNPSSISASQQVSAFLSNLQANTVYSFQACASNQYGQNCGSILSFLTTNTNAYVPVQPPYPPYQPCLTGCGPTQYHPVQYPPQQYPPTVIYVNNGGSDYAENSSALAVLKLSASKREVERDGLVTYTVTLENISNRKIKNVEMNVSAPRDLILTSTSFGEISFASNSIKIKLPSLSAKDSKSFSFTARAEKDTKAKSFVVHADASYLNTLTGERETVTAELMTAVERNFLLAGAFGAGISGGLIWFLIALLIILLILYFVTRDRRSADTVPPPPSRWPTA